MRNATTYLIVILGLAGCDVSDPEPKPVPVVSNRPVLSIQFLNDLTSLRNGDTLRADLTNQSTTVAIQVASDYWGLRLVGDYLVTVKPSETRTMEWIVVASTGQSFWVDLSWGTYGQTQRIDFQTR